MLGVFIPPMPEEGVFTRQQINRNPFVHVWIIIHLE